MDLQQFTLFGMIKDQMDWSSKRQQVLSRNIANSDTPGYLPSDIKPLDFKKTIAEVTSPQLAVTDGNHLMGSPSKTSSLRVEKERHPEEIKPDGNGVTLEDQIMKVGDTKGKYDMAASLYQKQIMLLKMSVGSGR
ncbi:MAG: flagellar basal body rod protein FlgB [Alphaproteobacteria bacterium]|nr:flagellar basal body rod protein FlgB [Alphaproteobacteria bacterium]